MQFIDTSGNSVKEFTGLVGNEGLLKLGKVNLKGGQYIVNVEGQNGRLNPIKAFVSAKQRRINADGTKSPNVIVEEEFVAIDLDDLISKQKENQSNLSLTEALSILQISEDQFNNLSETEKKIILDNIQAEQKNTEFSNEGQKFNNLNEKLNFETENLPKYSVDLDTTDQAEQQSNFEFSDNTNTIQQINKPNLGLISPSNDVFSKVPETVSDTYDQDKLKELLEQLSNINFSDSSNVSEAFINLPDGSIKSPDGFIKLPDGSIKSPDGFIKLPDGSIKSPDGFIKLPDGSIKSPDGSTKLTDGSIKSPDGFIKLPDGSIKSPDGSIKLEDNSIKLSDGTIIDHDTYQTAYQKLEKIQNQELFLADGSESFVNLPNFNNSESQATIQKIEITTEEIRSNNKSITQNVDDQNISENSLNNLEFRTLQNTAEIVSNDLNNEPKLSSQQTNNIEINDIGSRLNISDLEKSNNNDIQSEENNRSVNLTTADNLSVTQFDKLQQSNNNVEQIPYDSDQQISSQIRPLLQNLSNNNQNTIDDINLNNKSTEVTNNQNFANTKSIPLQTVSQQTNTFDLKSEQIDDKSLFQKSESIENNRPEEVKIPKFETISEQLEDNIQENQSSEFIDIITKQNYSRLPTSDDVGNTNYNSQIDNSIQPKLTENQNNTLKNSENKNKGNDNQTKQNEVLSIDAIDVNSNYENSNQLKLQNIQKLNSNFESSKSNELNDVNLQSENNKAQNSKFSLQDGKRLTMNSLLQDKKIDEELNADNLNRPSSSGYKIIEDDDGETEENEDEKTKQIRKKIKYITIGGSIIAAIPINSEVKSQENVENVIDDSVKQQIEEQRIPIEQQIYNELLKQRENIQSRFSEIESNKATLRRAEDNIQNQLVYLLNNSQSLIEGDGGGAENSSVNQIIQNFINQDRAAYDNLQQEATNQAITNITQNYLAQKEFDEAILRQKIERELKYDFKQMQFDHEQKMKIVYRRMLESMYSELLNS